MKNSLIKAINSDNLPDAKRLLDAGANPNAQDAETTQTPLGIVVRSFKESAAEFIDLLMAYGADPNFVFKSNSHSTTASPFTVACMQNNEKAIMAMLNSAGPIKVDLLKAQGNQWMSSMSVACSSSNFLMEKLQNFFEKNTLFQKGKKSHFEKGHLWLSVDDLGKNAFMHTGRHESKRWILDCNFSDEKNILEQKDNKGETALWISVVKRNQECVEFLLSRGAQIEIFDLNGKSLLKKAGESYPEEHTPASRNILGLLKAVQSSRNAMAAINEIVSLNQLDRP